MTSTPPTIRFSSELEKKSYQRGVEEIARKRSKAKRAETAAERHQRTLADGERLIVRKLGYAGACKLLGREPARTMDTPRTGGTIKQYSRAKVHYTNMVPLFS